MKIIEAMKELKRLAEKAADLRKKVALYCVDLDYETPVYGADQKKQIDEWMQSHADTVQRIADIRVAIQATNLATFVSIEIGGKTVKKSIAEWIHRRGDKQKPGLARTDLEMWTSLGDRGLREGVAAQSTGSTIQVKIRRYFDPAKRDQMVAMYREESSIIDGQLEVVNAVTDVIGL